MKNNMCCSSIRNKNKTEIMLEIKLKSSLQIFNFINHLTIKKIIYQNTCVKIINISNIIHILYSTSIQKKANYKIK